MRTYTNSSASSKKGSTRRFTSKRLWFAGLALGVMLGVQSPDRAAAQAPHTVSYQGQILDQNGVPATGTASINVNYYVAGNPTPLFNESFSGTPLVGGVYSIQLGSQNPQAFANLDFSKPIEIGVQINNGAELTPHTAFSAVPYAFNAYTLNGIPSSLTPKSGTIFPLTLDANNHIDPSLLPTLTVNGRPLQNNNLNIIPGQNISFDTTGGQIVINSTGNTGGGNGINTIIAQNGLVGGGSGSTVSVGIDPNGISGSLIKAGTITGRQLDSHVAGAGLVQEPTGNLDVNLDNSTFFINTNNQLSLRQGIPVNFGAGTFTSLNTGSLTDNGNLTVNGSIDATGHTIQNVGNPTAANEATSKGYVDAQFTSGIPVTFGNGTFTNLTTGGITSNGQLDMTGHSITNVGAPTSPNDVANKSYVDGVFFGQAGPLVGDIAGTLNNTQINTASAGIGDRLITGVNAGTTMIDAARINPALTVNGGTIDNTPIGANGASTGAFTNLSSTGTASFSGTVTVPNPVNLTDAATKNYVDNQIANVNSAQGDVTGPTNDRTINTSNPGVGDRVITSINNGTTTINATRIGTGLTDAQVSDNLTINGGTINNTPIGAITRSTGAFTNLAANGNITLGSNAGSTVTVGNSTGAVNFSGSSYNFGGTRLGNLGAPVLGTDAATLNYVNQQVANATTLSGDVMGSTGSAQINASNAGVGDRLINGINSSTSTINAARVAAGLTDAQVNDNLTINGGTVDNTPIGAITPSTGAFTNLSATGTNSIMGTTTVGGNLSFAAASTIDAGNNAITNVGDPSNLGDAANKGYVDANINTASTLGGDLTGTTGAAQIAQTQTTGDNIISSINNGSTTINAANINPALTINGGTIDATPIGATSASTGAFTDLGATGNVTLASGAGNNVTVGNSTGMVSFAADSVDFGGTRLSAVGAPINGTDAATKSYVDTKATTASTLGGDLTGTTGAALLNTTNAGIGDRLIAGVNNGTTAIDASRINPALTVNGGTIDNTPIGATGASTGAFTDLSASGNTTFTGSIDAGGSAINNVGTPVASTDAATRGYVDAGLTTASTLGGDLTGTTGAAQISQTGATGDNIISSVNMGSSTIDAARIGNGLTDAQVNDNLTINGGTIDNTAIGATTPSTGAFTMLSAINADSTAAALTITRGGLRANATTAQQGGAPTTVSERFADFTAATSGVDTVVINNSLVTANSTIILTLESGTPQYLSVSSKTAGSFTVKSSGNFNTGDAIDYMIVNP